MKIVEYFSSEYPEHWLTEIGRCDWSAGRFLHQLLQERRFHTLLGEKSRLLLLTEGVHLIAFCTYAQRDEIPTDELTPWVGFVYTFPQDRGKRRMGKLLEYVYLQAKADGYPCVYISTDHTGLYEKYGCTFWKTMQDAEGNDCRIYRMEIERRDYSAILDRQVSGTIARCGLACCLCSENVLCKGCRRDGFMELSWCKDAEWCEVRRCGIDKGIAGCYECEPAGCRKGLYAEKIKARAFAEFARRYGVEELLDCLERNEQAGVVYHREGIMGDYDDFDDPEELIRFIRTGPLSAEGNTKHAL